MSRSITLSLCGAAAILAFGAFALSKTNANRNPTNLGADKSLLKEYAGEAMMLIPRTHEYGAKLIYDPGYGDEALGHYLDLVKPSAQIFGHFGYVRSNEIIIQGSCKGEPAHIWYDVKKINGEMLAQETLYLGQDMGTPIYRVDLFFNRDVERFEPPEVYRVAVFDLRKGNEIKMCERDVANIDTEIPDILKDLSD